MIQISIKQYTKQSCLILLLFLCTTCSFSFKWKQESTNFPVDSIILFNGAIPHYGQRLWPIDRKLQDTIYPTDKDLYYCLDVNDTIVILTYNENVFSTNIPSLNKEEFNKYFNKYEIVIWDDAPPYTARITTDVNSLYFRRNIGDDSKYFLLVGGTIQDNEFLVNPYLKIGMGVDSILTKLGLLDIIPYLKNKKTI